jgi:ornithine cyclodeaminase
MLILDSADVIRSLPMPQAIEVMHTALQALSEGRAQIPLRTRLETSRQAGTTLVMPGCIEDEDRQSLAVKVVSIFNGNRARGLPNILGLVNVFDPATGRPIAVIDGSAVTAIRTAATSGAATRALASPDARRLAIIGSGMQARWHFHAMCAVRDIRSATFFAPRRDRLESLIGELETGVELHVANSPAEATHRAQIICTTTNSPTPVIQDGAVPPGCHINAIGSYQPAVVEIPEATVIRSRIYVDQRSTALAEAGDLIQPIRRGKLDESAIVGEIGELFAGRIAGRTDPDQVTLFKSVGNTVEDVAAADAIVKMARRLGLGHKIPLGSWDAEGPQSRLP